MTSPCVLTAGIVMKRRSKNIVLVISRKSCNIKKKKEKQTETLAIYRPTFAKFVIQPCELCQTCQTLPTMCQASDNICPIIGRSEDMAAIATARAMNWQSGLRRSIACPDGVRTAGSWACLGSRRGHRRFFFVFRSDAVEGRCSSCPRTILIVDLSSCNRSTMRWGICFGACIRSLFD